MIMFDLYNCFCSPIFSLTARFKPNLTLIPNMQPPTSDATAYKKVTIQKMSKIRK